MKSLLLFLILCCSNLVLSQGINKTITVYFDFNSSQLNSIELEKLDSFKEEGVAKIVQIGAHTDSSGTIQYNNRLAERRLQLVTDYINYIGQNAMVIGESEANHALNYVDSKFRKVEIVYVVSMPPIIETPVEKIKDVEPTLESSAKDFISSTESTLSIDLSIHFHPGTATPLLEAYPELDRLVVFMKENSTLDAFLHGHVCCSNNLDVSERRALYVYNYLIKNGIAETRLSHMGHGSTQPKTTPEITEEDRISNRRVNVIFTRQ